MRVNDRKSEGELTKTVRGITKTLRGENAQVSDLISFKLLRNVREAELVEDDFVFKWGRNDNCII